MPGGSGKLSASSDLPVAVSRQRTLGSLRVRAAPGMEMAQRALEADGEWWTCTCSTQTSAPVVTAVVHYALRCLDSSRPVLYTRATRRRRSRLSGISRCNSTLFVKR